MNALELCIEHYRNGKEIWKSTESVVTGCHIEALREAFDTNYNFVNYHFNFKIIENVKD